MKQIFIPQSHLTEIEAIVLKKRTLGNSPASRKTALFILHCCYLRPLQTGSVWTPISSRLLAKNAGGGSRSHLVVKRLCEEGFLECDGLSKPNKKCYSFRLGRKLAAGQWCRKNPKEKCTIANEPNMDSDGWESMEAAIKTVEDACQTFLWLSIDSDMAHKAIDQIAAEKAKTTEKWSSHRVCALHHQVDNFATRYSIRSTGRLYTHANRLPKELRRALLIDGEATVELDVKNCQALLLTLRYPSQSEESKRWRALVENGTLYDEYAAEFGITRHEAKHGHFFPLLFGSQKPQPRRYFEKHFPEILAVIDEANKEANECRRRRLKTRKEGLAHDLQRIESKIIVEGLCKAFRAVSIHDGVRVKASEATAARAYLQNAFQSLGLRAKITVDDEEEPSLSEEELEKFGFQQAA